MKAVILAGGLGTRLQPFTNIIPKPLLPVGESSVLEIQIQSLKEHGFTDIYIATNYRAEYVKAFLGNGDRYGVKLTFSNEQEPLGTCGPVKLLRNLLTEPFVLMNGDILTTINFLDVYTYAIETESDLTVVTKEITTPFNFGKVISDGKFITGVQEKPDIKFEILAGIYVLKPGVFDVIPEGYYGIDMLIKDMLKMNRPVSKFLTTEYWLDIGRENDYKTAQSVYHSHFKGGHSEKLTRPNLG